MQNHAGRHRRPKVILTIFDRVTALPLTFWSRNTYAHGYYGQDQVLCQAWKLQFVLLLSESANKHTIVIDRPTHAVTMCGVGN